MNTYILAFDTSHAITTCALGAMGDNGLEILFEETLTTPRSQGPFLVPSISKVLQQANLNVHDLQGMITTVGPGSFTGLRIALGALKGFEIAAPHLKIWGITSFEVFQYLGSLKLPNMPLTVVVESGREDVYLQRFDAQGRPLGEASILPLDQGETLHEEILVGSGVAKFMDHYQGDSHNIPHFTASDLLHVTYASGNFRPLLQASPSGVIPYYLKSPDVTVKNS